MNPSRQPYSSTPNPQPYSPNQLLNPTHLPSPQPFSSTLLLSSTPQPYSSILLLNLTSLPYPSHVHNIKLSCYFTCFTQCIPPLTTPQPYSSPLLPTLLLRSTPQPYSSILLLNLTSLPYSSHVHNIKLSLSYLSVLSYNISPVSIF